MKLSVDKQADALLLSFKEGVGFKRKQEVADNIFLLLDEQGKCIAIEVLALTNRVGREIGVHLDFDFAPLFESPEFEVDIKPFPNLPGTERK